VLLNFYNKLGNFLINLIAKVGYSNISLLEPLSLVIQNNFNEFLRLTDVKMHPESQTWNTLANKLNNNKIHLTPSAICSNGCDKLQDPEFSLATHVDRTNTTFILVFSSFTYILKKASLT